ncbi:MAG: insulinase family protein [Treponema sp.]|nr:insulinase family protein [Treponema sp.]MCL2271302.1 insulinase family protein [Treponema sp.]
MKKIITVLIILVFLVNAAGFTDEKVPLTNLALTGTLPNGLTYFILENTLPENRAHLALAVNAGSVLETDDQRGFAHFVEHLAFNDTARFPKHELIEYLRSLGMRFGADANAYTSYDETVYHFDVPVEIQDGIKRIPDKALAILDDWTYAVSFKPEDVESEKQVVLEEMRSRLGASDRVQKITLPIIFAGSQYEDRHVIGLAEIIENATSQKLKAFYDRWYTSDNMALIFVGDFDGKKLEAELSRHFSMPKSSQPVNRPVFELPPPVSGNFHVEFITDPELTSADIMIYLKQEKGPERGTVAYYRESVVDYLIAVMLGLRFEEIISNPAASAIEYWASPWMWSNNSRFYAIGASPKTGSAEEALKELLLEKERVRRYGFTESELYIAKLMLVSYMERQLSEKDRRESRTFIRGFTNHFLYGEDLADIEWEVNAVNSMLEDIGIQNISKAVNGYLSANDYIVFITAPAAEAASLPGADRIKEIFSETEMAVITPRAETSVSADLLYSEPFAGEIISQETDEETGASLFVLSNGTKVILKETANRNNEIILYAMAKGGTANSAQEHFPSINLVPEMLNVSGLGPYSRTEMANKLAGKQVSFSFWNTNFYRGFQGSSTAGDLKTFFEMIHLFFGMPGLEERAVDAMMDQYRTNLAHQDDDPQGFFSRELTKFINNSHPLYKPLEAEDLDKVSIDIAKNYLTKCINPSDYTFVFTGNINMEEMKGYLEKYLASIPNFIPMNEWQDPGVIRPSEGEKILYKGQDERCMVYLSWLTQAEDNFNEKTNQTAAILSEYLDIVLTNEIREKLGGVYSISAGASVNVIPKGEYQLSVYFMCNPVRAEELIAAVKNCITEIADTALNQDTFNKSREALFMQHENSMQRNLHIAQSYVNSSVLYNTPLSRLNNRPDVIRDVTMQDVQELCRRMMSSGHLKVVLYPEGRE